MSPSTTCDPLLGGLWVDDSPEDVPQCQVGCCIIGEEANFITETSCIYKVSIIEEETEYEFLKNVQDGGMCASLANPREMGACVDSDSSGGRDCTHETRENCQNSGLDFYEGFLCSAPELNTKCGPSDTTSCMEGEEEVYFRDTCGNYANVYDVTKIDDTLGYWTEMISTANSCFTDIGDENSVSSCGNCVFRLGSTCGKYRPGEDVAPDEGNYVCRDLSCEYDNDGDGIKESYEHEERWCADAGWIDGTPGKEEIVLTCYNGQITKERCSSYRKQVCFETVYAEEEIDDNYTIKEEDFTQAACVVNSYPACYGFQTKSDCEDQELVDCQWLLANKDTNLYDSLWESTELGIPENMKNSEKGFCLPAYAPGIKFWEEEAASSCNSFIPSEYVCGVEYEKGLIEVGKYGDWDLVEDEVTCFKETTSKADDLPKTKLDSTWQTQMKNVCLATSDCGVKTNYLGVNGYYSWKDLFVGDYIEDSLSNYNSYGGGK